MLHFGVERASNINTKLTLNYDLSGNILTENLIHNLGKLKRTYDQEGRCTQISSPYHRETATYTQNNLTTRTLDNQTHSYLYDDNSQLTTEPKHTYTYDSIHTRLTHNEEQTLLTYDEDGRQSAHEDTHTIYQN